MKTTHWFFFCNFFKIEQAFKSEPISLIRNRLEILEIIRNNN